MDEKTPVSATKKCRACLKEIEVKAKKCHLCGSDQRNWFVKHKIITALLVLIFFPTFIGSVSSQMKSVNGDQNQNTDQTPIRLSTLGDEGYLRSPDNQEKSIPLTEEEYQYSQLLKSLAAKDVIGLSEIPNLFDVTSGAKVKVIDMSVGMRKVRILEVVKDSEKDRIGRSGWTETEYVVDR